MIRIKTISVLTVFTFFIASCTAATQAAPTEKPTSLPTALSTIAPTLAVEETPTASQNGLPQTEADVPRVSVEDAVAAIKSGEAVVVDVRSAEAYQQSHIPGALSVPLFDIEQNPAGIKLDKDKWIITYCT